MTSMPIHFTEIRNRTVAELQPHMSLMRMLDHGAAGRTADGYVTLTINEDAARHLGEVLMHYTHQLDHDQVDDVDHDRRFWDAIALDLILAATAIDPPPPGAGTAMVYSIGKTADLGKRAEQ